MVEKTLQVTAYEAYNWYLNLKPRTVHDQEHPVSLFNTKLFYAKAKFTLAQLDWTCKYSGEDLDAYVKRVSRESSGLVWSSCWDCASWGLLSRKNRWLSDYLGNLSFSFFSRLMEAARRDNDLSSKSSSLIDLHRRKGKWSQRWKRMSELRAVVRWRCPTTKEKPDDSLSFHLFIFGAKKSATLLQHG